MKMLKQFLCLFILISVSFALNLSDKNTLYKLLNDFKFQYKLFKKSRVINGKYTYVDEYGNKLVFTVDPYLQTKVKKYLLRHRVKYGCFVALEPKTGKVLASVYGKRDICFKNDFPTASTFKVIAAALALEKEILSPKSYLRYRGHPTSISFRNWIRGRYVYKATLEQALAKSVNPFFGILAYKYFRGFDLDEYAKKWGFNLSFYNFPWGTVKNLDSLVKVSKTAAGLGPTKFSPFHGALIAATIANDGVMPVPSFVEAIYDKNNNLIYSFTPKYFWRVIDSDIADKLSDMLEKTYAYGTVSREKEFRKFKRTFKKIKIAGKTGTLSNRDYPKGLCQWFIGFADYKDPSIAVASLGVNRGYMTTTGYGISAYGLRQYFLKKLGYVKTKKNTYSKPRYKVIYYRVKKGDTLYYIARKFNVRVRDIKKWNKLKYSYVYPGQRLIIYKPYSFFKKRKYIKIKYKVKKGDTLYNISKKFRVSISKIKRWNKLKSNLLYPGQVLIIYKVI